MITWSGTISEKSFTDWNGTKLWSFKIEGEEKWFRTGKVEIEQSVGDMIEFDERNSKVSPENIRMGAFIITSGAARQVIAKKESVLEASAPTVGDVGKRIQWQAARADACNIVVACLALEATNVEAKGILPWAANVAKSKKLDLLRGYINELTKQFIEEEV